MLKRKVKILETLGCKWGTSGFNYYCREVKSNGVQSPGENDI
jgi:hypothetical protein